MQVRHDPLQLRFLLEEDGHTSFLEYERIDHETLDYTHTFVPEALRGRGIAGRLVAGALEYAREHGIEVVPSCSYVASFIDRHPEYRSLVKGES